MIHVELPGSVAPGKVLEGRVKARTESGKAPRGLVVVAGWRTEGRGRRDAHDAVTVRLDAGGGAEWPVDGEVRIPIPAEGPVSFDGELVRIVWELRIRLDIPWGRDETLARVFRVACGP